MLARVVETAIDVADVTISVEDELVEIKVERAGADRVGGEGRARDNGLGVVVRTVTVDVTAGIVLSGTFRIGGEMLVCAGVRALPVAVVRGKGEVFVARRPAVIESLRRGRVCSVASCLVGACSKVIRWATGLGQLVPAEFLFGMLEPGQQPCVED